MNCCFVRKGEMLAKKYADDSYAFLRSVLKMVVIKVRVSLIRQSIRYLLCSSWMLAPHFANALVVCILSIIKRTKIMPGKRLPLVWILPVLLLWYPWFDVVITMTASSLLLALHLFPYTVICRYRLGSYLFRAQWKIVNTCAVQSMACIHAGLNKKQLPKAIYHIPSIDSNRKFLLLILI